MTTPDFFKDFENCTLCEHRCGANRLKGETGVCGMTMPVIASAQLHPAPPASYTVFMAGCNYKCLNCQNWTISFYPDNRFTQRGYQDPEKLAEEGLHRLSSYSARQMKADRIFFSGGEPTIHLPYIEAVVGMARHTRPETKINFDTNGYMTEESLIRILEFTTSITFDLKAYRDEVHYALTGASSKPVLRNAGNIGRFAREQLWEYRILVIPNMNENEIRPLTEFIAGIDPELPVCFLAFRPNFALENHPGATRNLMGACVEISKHTGLKNVYWSGYTGLAGKVMDIETEMEDKYFSEEARLAGSYAFQAGCKTHPRSCSDCAYNKACEMKTYVPGRET